jgi:hypothetical protein
MDEMRQWCDNLVFTGPNTKGVRKDMDLLTPQEFEKAQCLMQMAKKLGSQGLKKQASTMGAQSLHIFNQAVVRKIETGDLIDTRTNSEDVELVYSDISVPMPVEPDRRGYNLLLNLIEKSPLAQEILAVLKKYEDSGSIDLDNLGF